MKECARRGEIKVEHVDVRQPYLHQVDEHLNPFSQAVATVAMANAEHAILIILNSSDKDGYILLADSE